MVAWLIRQLQATGISQHTAIDEMRTARHISSRIRSQIHGELSDLLRDRRRLAFEEMFDGLATKFDLVITFLALLEMTKLRMTRLFQSEPLGPLYIELAAGEEEASP